MVRYQGKWCYGASQAGGPPSRWNHVVIVELKKEPSMDGGWAVAATLAAAVIAAAMGWWIHNRYSIWEARRPAYESAHQLIDQIEVAVTAITRRPHSRQDLDDMEMCSLLARWEVIVGKTSDGWRTEADAIRRLGTHLNSLTVAEDSNDPDWKHQQGREAFAAKAQLTQVRDEINNQWGPRGRGSRGRKRP
ncbi:hypothetical protein ACFQ3B_08565 [Stackebrandtia endophytica]|nr:hypothetical protein [Stackebrandtia endophytica]